MAPSRRKGASKAAAAAAARRQWKVGDLVLAKVKGFPAWPATVSEPEKWGYSCDWKKVLVYFFGTKQIAFCNPADVEEFTEEKKLSLLGKRQGRGADFLRAVQEIVDCYDKLKESNLADQRMSGDASAENAAVGELNSADGAAPDTTRDLTLRSSNPRSKDEPTIAVEDVGALTEVESLHRRGESEEPAGNAVTPRLAMANTYTLRKKSRSIQPQRCASQKKVSAQRARSSLRFDSLGLQNGVSNCIDGKSSADGGINGFWDGPLRKAKRSKRSPDGSVPDAGDSPVCNSNGTVEDNGSDIAMADSENLSNNECSAIEYEHKREQSEIGNSNCDGGHELSRSLDFQAKTAIVRKKRNPGRKRVHHDGQESTSRPGQETNKDVRIHRDTFVLPTSSGIRVDSQPKDEGDEHLPLVKRARVRVGKVLSEEQQQFDILVKSEEKSLDSASTSTVREAKAVSNCDDVHSSNSLLLASKSIVSSPMDDCSQVPDNKPQLPKTDSCTVDEPMACSLSDNSLEVTENKSQTSKANTNQPCGSSFDGESALPPTKRLNRALEAMLANAAEENHTSGEVPLSPKRDIEGSRHAFTETCSSVIVEDKGGNNLESLNFDNASRDDCFGGSNISDLATCEINKAFSDVAMPVSSNRDLESINAFWKDNVEEVAISADNKNFSGSGCTRGSHGVLQDQASEAVLTSVVESEIILESVTAVLAKPPSEDLSKTRETETCNDLAENNKSESELHCERGIISVSGKEEVLDVTNHDGATVTPSAEEAKCSSATDIPRASADGNTQPSCLGEAVEEVSHAAAGVNMSSPLLIVSSPQQTSDGASISGCLSRDLSDVRNTTSAVLAEVGMHKCVSHPNHFTAASDNNDHSRYFEGLGANAKIPLHKHVSDATGGKCLDIGVRHQTKSGERTNLAEVKAALASLELTLGSLTRTKESIGRATRIAVDCVKFGVASEVVELLALFLEKESSMYRRVDLFFLVDSIAQCTRGLKGDVGGTYISAVEKTLKRLISAAAPAGQAARENRRQCLKVLRLWLERKILPESIIRHLIRELDSLNCSSSTGGYSRRMSRTERSFDDPLRDMDGMLVDEYGSNSSFQLPGFCMPRMLKEEDDGSDSDGECFEAVTPEHDSQNQETEEVTAQPATEKRRHILEDVDGELEMEDVAPTCDLETDPAHATAVDAAANRHHCKEQFTSFVPPLPHDVPPRAPPLPTSPPPLPPLPPPPPPPPPLVPHASAVPHADVDPHLHAGRNSMQEGMLSRPPAPAVHHPVQMPASTTCSYNSYPVMHNPVAPGNKFQSADGNLYCNKAYNNLRPPLPSPSGQFSYLPGDQQFRPQREVPPPPYYDRSRFGQSVDGGHFYGEQDNARPPRLELTDGWGYSRPPFPSSMHAENHSAYPPTCSGPSCEPMRPQNHGWAHPPHPVHHRNHIPNRPPCDGGVPVGVRAPGYWRPR